MEGNPFQRRPLLRVFDNLVKRRQCRNNIGAIFRVGIDHTDGGLARNGTFGLHRTNFSPEMSRMDGLLDILPDR